MIPTWGQQFGLDALISSADLSLADLTHSAIAYKGAVTPSMTRSTTATCVDSWGRQVTCLAGELRFPLVRRVRNLVPASEDLNNASWLTTQTVKTSATQISDNNVNATHFFGAALMTVGRRYAVQFRASLAAGTKTIWFGSTGTDIAEFNLSTGATQATSGTSGLIATQVSAGVWDCSGIITAATGTTLAIGFANGFGNYTYANGGSTNTFNITRIQLEDITGQSVQTAGEYVSVGALDYRSTLNPLYLSLPGTAGHSATSPDKDITTGDMALVVDCALADYTPAALQMLLAKDTSGANRDWGLYQDTAGIKPLILYWFQADGTAWTATSTAAPSFPDGQRVQFAATLDVDDGAGNHVVKFWTSTDNWASKTQLGTTVTQAGVTDVRNSTALLYIGNYGAGGPTAGNFYSAQVYAAIPTFLSGAGGETLKVDFNPHRDATTPTGTITSSTTGEVWTLNGASSVVRSAAYHGSMVDGVKCFPTDLSGNPLTGMTTPLIELAATTKTRKSQSFSDAVWAKTSGSISTTQNALGADGSSTSGWTLTDSGAGVAENISQSHTLTAANWTDSYLVKKTTGAQSTYPVVWATVGTTAALATIDTTNGVATVWTAFTGYTIATSSARCTSYNADFWLVELTYLATATTWFQIITPAAVSSATQATGTFSAALTGSAVFFDSQRELGDKATSRTLNTNAAADATRNADQFYYTGPLFANIKTLVVRGFKREVGVSNGAYIVALSDGTANEIAQMQFDSSQTAVRFVGVDGGVTQWNTPASNAYTPGTLSNMAQSFATNDIKMAKDGVAQTADTSATIPTVNRLEIGMGAGIAQLNGYPGKIYGWTRNLSQSELNGVSA